MAEGKKKITLTTLFDEFQKLNTRMDKRDAYEDARFELVKEQNQNTQAEMRAGFSEVRKEMATKEELAQIRKEMATKDFMYDCFSKISMEIKHVKDRVTRLETTQSN